MTRICNLSGASFEVSQRELDYCAKQQISLPRHAPRERLRNMMAFRNRAHLYPTTCSHTNERILSCIPPERGLVVYGVEAWESDEWDRQAYGMEYDFSRSFFSQFAELLSRVPHPDRAVLNSTMENSDYTNGITRAKNCYLVFAASDVEDCLFSKYINRCRSCLDCCYTFDSELCYGCRNITNCYNLRYSDGCVTCSDSAFLSNCRSCSYCYCCSNLSNKKYCYQNRQLTKEEYFKLRDGIDLGSEKTVREEREIFESFRRQFPVRFMFGRNHENSVGDYLSNVKNCDNCFFINNGEDLEHSVWVDGGKSSLFYSMYGNGGELIYNCQSVGDNAYNLKFCLDCWSGVSDLEYCMFTVYGSTHCFGCVGIKKQSYCVLNRQYSKNDYFELVGRIKNQMREGGEYGLFFPPQLTPFYYNQSEVSEFYPSDEKSVVGLGYTWAKNEERSKQHAAMLPDHISEVERSLVGEVMTCERSGRPYKIISQEFEYYRKHKIPVPRIAPFERLEQLTSFLALADVRNAKCAECSSEIRTCYGGSGEQVLCEDCYQRAMS